MTYADLIREYDRQKGLRRWLIFVPVGRHLIEGLKNPTVFPDRKAMEVFSVRAMGAKEAIQNAIANTMDAVVPLGTVCASEVFVGQLRLVGQSRLKAKIARRHCGSTVWLAACQSYWL